MQFDSSDLEHASCYQGSLEVWYDITGLRETPVKNICLQNTKNRSVLHARKAGLVYPTLAVCQHLPQLLLQAETKEAVALLAGRVVELCCNCPARGSFSQIERT